MLTGQGLCKGRLISEGLGIVFMPEAIDGIFIVYADEYRFAVFAGFYKAVFCVVFFSLHGYV